MFDISINRDFKSIYNKLGLIRQALALFFEIVFIILNIPIILQKTPSVGKLEIDIDLGRNASWVSIIGERVE